MRIDCHKSPLSGRNSIQIIEKRLAASNVTYDSLTDYPTCSTDSKSHLDYRGHGTQLEFEKSNLMLVQTMKDIEENQFDELSTPVRG